MADTRPPARRVIAALFRKSLADATSEVVPATMQAVGLAVALVSQAWLGRLVDRVPNPALGAYAGRFPAYLLVGMALLDLMSSVVHALGQRLREAQLQGTLEALLATPASPAAILAGVTLPDAVMAIGRLTLYAVVGVVFFGLDFRGASWLGLLLIIAAALVAFAALALLGGALTLWLRRTDPLGIVLGSAALVAGGVMYPREVLPDWAARLGAWHPISPVLDGVRAALLEGRLPHEALARLGLLVAILGPLAVAAFAAALRRARIDGSLTSP